MTFYFVIRSALQSFEYLKGTLFKKTKQTHIKKPYKTPIISFSTRVCGVFLAKLTGQEINMGKYP